MDGFDQDDTFGQSQAAFGHESTDNFGAGGDNSQQGGFVQDDGFGGGEYYNSTTQAQTDGGEYDPTAAYMTPATNTAESNDAFFGSSEVVDTGVPTPGYFAPDGTYVPPTGMKQESASREEDDTLLKKWEEEHRASIQQKDDEERAAVADREASARKELEDFAASRAKRIEVTNETNLTAERAFIADRDAEVHAANLWDRVTQLVDVSKASKDQNEKEGVVDVSRFRSLLLDLKYSPA